MKIFDIYKVIRGRHQCAEVRCWLQAWRFHRWTWTWTCVHTKVLRTRLQFKWASFWSLSTTLHFAAHTERLDFSEIRNWIFFFFFFEKRRSNASFGKSIKRANRCPHEMYHVYLISNHANYNLNKFYIEDAIKAAAAAPVDTSKLIAFCVSDAIGGARTFSMPSECGLVNWSAAAFANWLFVLFRAEWFYGRTPN